MELPTWLDVPKIAGLTVLVLAFVQYFKTSIPEKYIRYFAIVVGIILGILCELYIGAKVIWVKAILNGAIAAILADTTYGFLSKAAGGSFVLPSKSDLEKPK